jgi:hypothetical protein
MANMTISGKTRDEALSREGLRSFAVVTGALNTLALSLQLGVAPFFGKVFTATSALQEVVEGGVQIGLAALLWQQSGHEQTPVQRLIVLYVMLFVLLVGLSAYYDAMFLPESASLLIQPTWGAFFLLLHGALARGLPHKVDMGCIIAALLSIHVSIILQSGSLIVPGVSFGSLMWRGMLVWFPLAFCGASIVLLRAMQRREQRMVAALQAELLQLGAYKLERRIGQGGMGEVWLGRHELLARPAAIKLVRPAPEEAGARHEEVIQRFEREAKLTAGLSSQHTVRLYDFGLAAGGMRYYAMELLEGITLEELVERWGAQPEARARAIMMQVCESLAEAHEAGLVHRDIKPSNIMLCRQGKRRDVVKVLDFGLVLDRTRGETRAAAGSGAVTKIDPRLTQRGFMMGTPAFIAPEQAMGLETVDGRADLYALGCVVYYLVTGLQVFEGEIVEILQAHVDRRPVEPSKRRRDIKLSVEFEVLLMCCLSKKPEERPPSAWLLREELLRQEERAQRWGEAQQAAWYAQLDPDATWERPADGVAMTPQQPRLLRRVGRGMGEG